MAVKASEDNASRRPPLEVGSGVSTEKALVRDWDQEENAETGNVSATVRKPRCGGGAATALQQNRSLHGNMQRRLRPNRLGGLMALVSYSFVVPPLLVIDALPITATHVPHDGTEDARSRDLQRGGDRLTVEPQLARRHAAPSPTKQLRG